MPDRPAKSCSRCGGPLELRHLQGLEVEVCVRCGAAVLDRADLENLAASAVMSAPEARPTDAGVVQVRTPTPLRPERKKPWDFTPRPAPPRKPPRRVEKTLIPTLLEPGEDETEEGPMIVAHRIHDSEPPVRPREAVPDSELPTGPPTPAPRPKAGPPRPPPVKAITPSAPSSLGPSLARAEPSLGKPSSAVPPPPPPTLGRTVRPEDGNAPAVRPPASLGAGAEPGLGRLPPHAVDEPGLDLEGPEPSTEEAPFQRITRDAPPVVALDGPLPDDEQIAWEASGGRVRAMLLAASGVTAAGAALALIALAVWVTWLGPRWRERAAEVRGPDLAEIVGAPTGDVVLEHPEPVVPAEPAVPADGPPEGEREDTSAPTAPAPPPEPAPMPAPTTSPEPLATAAPTPQTVAPRPTPAPVVVSRERLIERGWETVESDPDAALAAFGQALDASPSDHEAAYGYGYALLEKGDPAAAGPYLCRARPSPDVTIQREVAGLIARHGIACP